MLAVLFIAVLIFHAIGRDLDGAQVLGFLGVITTLVGVPSGWQLIKRTSNGNGGGGGAAPPK